MQAYDSIICGYFCIGLIGFMLKDKSLTDLVKSVKTFFTKSF